MSDDLCEVCRYVGGPTWCDHAPATVDLARALAGHFQNVPDPSMEQVSWFIEDADSISGNVGPGPWTFRRVEALGLWDEAVIVNDTLFCGMRSGEGMVPLEAVCRVNQDAA